MHDDDTEPPVPAGLGDLSAGLQAVADFFEIDEDLIAAAAAVSPSIEEPRGLRNGSPPSRPSGTGPRGGRAVGAAADRKDARVRAAEQPEREEEARKAAAQAAA